MTDNKSQLTLEGIPASNESGGDTKSKGTKSNVETQEVVRSEITGQKAVESEVSKQSAAESEKPKPEAIEPEKPAERSEEVPQESQIFEVITQNTPEPKPEPAKPEEPQSSQISQITVKKSHKKSKKKLPEKTPLNEKQSEKEPAEETAPVKAGHTSTGTRPTNIIEFSDSFITPKGARTPENTKVVLITDGYGEIESDNGRLILTIYKDKEIISREALVLSTLIGILNKGGFKVDNKAIYALQKAGIVIVNITRTTNNEIWELKVGGRLQRRGDKYVSWWSLEMAQKALLDSPVRVSFFKAILIGKIIAIRNLGEMDSVTFKNLIENVKEAQTLEDLTDIVSQEGNATENHMWNYLRNALRSIDIAFEKRIRFGKEADKDEDQDLVNYILDKLMVHLRYDMIVLLAHANITPYISCLHKVSATDVFHMGLASDLITLFEPYMARLAFLLMREGIGNYAEEVARGNRKIIQLNDEGRKKLYEAYHLFIITFHEDIYINPYAGTIHDQMYYTVVRFKNILLTIKKKIAC
jgi:CRISPR/Cas system-associated endonuclease Cas1